MAQYSLRKGFRKAGASEKALRSAIDHHTYHYNRSAYLRKMADEAFLKGQRRHSHALMKKARWVELQADFRLSRAQRHCRHIFTTAGFVGSNRYCVYCGVVRSQHG